jgi:hypothetical protein
MDETGKKKILGPLALFNPPHFYLLILIPTRYIGYPIVDSRNSYVVYIIHDLSTIPFQHISRSR